MRIDAPETDAADELADAWVDLASSQRAHGAHLLADENREQIRESILQHIVTDGVRVGRDADDALLGFVMFAPESSQYRQDVRRGVVQNIYVHPDHRSEGVGAALLAAAETALAAKGVDVVSLDVMADNRRARAFYERQGYDPHRVTVEKAVENDKDSSEN